MQFKVACTTVKTQLEWAHERAPNIHHNLPYIPSIYAIQKLIVLLQCFVLVQRNRTNINILFVREMCIENCNHSMKNNCSPNIQLTLTRPAKGERTGTETILHIKITLKLPRLLPVVLLRILSPSLLTLLLNPYCRHTE